MQNLRIIENLSGEIAKLNIKIDEIRFDIEIEKVRYQKANEDYITLREFSHKL